MNIRDFLTDHEKAAVKSALQEAEKQTSGEIRVHLENHCREDVMDHAAFIFRKLEMHATKERNGVLFYIAVKDHKFAILGDAGLNAKVPPDFWDVIKDHMTTCFREGKFAEGIASGVRMAGAQLKAHFPRQTLDVNELSDDISYGGNK